MSTLSQHYPEILFKMLETLRDDMRWFWAQSLLCQDAWRARDSREPVSHYQDAREMLSKWTRVNRSFYLLGMPLLYSDCTVGFHPRGHPFFRHTRGMYPFYQILRRQTGSLTQPWDWRSHVHPHGSVESMSIRTEFHAVEPEFWASRDVIEYLKTASQSTVVENWCKELPQLRESIWEQTLWGARAMALVVELMLLQCWNLTTLNLELNPHICLLHRDSPHTGANGNRDDDPVIVFPSLRDLRICIWGEEKDSNAHWGDASKTVEVLVDGSWMTLESLELKHSHFWLDPDLPIYWPRLRSLSFVDAMESPERMEVFLSAAPFIETFRFTYLSDDFVGVVPRLYPESPMTPLCLHKMFSDVMLKAENPFIPREPETNMQPLITQLKHLHLNFRNKDWLDIEVENCRIDTFVEYTSLETLTFDPSCIWKYIHKVPKDVRAKKEKDGEEKDFHLPAHRLEGHNLFRILPQQNLQELKILWFDRTFDELVEVQLWWFFRHWLTSRCIFTPHRCAHPDLPHLRNICLHGQRVSRVSSERMRYMIHRFESTTYPLTVTTDMELQEPVPTPLHEGPGLLIDSSWSDED